MGEILSVQMEPSSDGTAGMDVTCFITKDGDKDTNIETLATFVNVGTAIAKRYIVTERVDEAGTAVSAANKSNVWAPFTTYNGVHVEVAQARAAIDVVVVRFMVNGP